MDTITQEAHFRKRMLRYLENHNATETAIRYKTSRKTLYKWKKRYEKDPDIESLKDRSRRPKRSPKEQPKEQKEMVLNAWKKDKGGDKLVMWDNARKRGYKYTYETFLRTVRREDENIKTRRKRSLKPYKKAEFPGQKVQIDVKYVPSECVKDGQKYYQYTAIDEFSRLPFRQIYNEHSTHSSAMFLMETIKYFKSKGIKKIHLAQTDNGTEWTKALISNNPDNLTLFEKKAKQAGINLCRIRIATPRHNGKVERLHRKDQQRFFRKLKFSSFKEARKKLEAYQKRSISIPISTLSFKSPLQVLQAFKNSKTQTPLLAA
jgi:transposase